MTEIIHMSGPLRHIMLLVGLDITVLQSVTSVLLRKPGEVLIVRKINESLLLIKKRILHDPRWVVKQVSTFERKTIRIKLPN